MASRSGRLVAAGLLSVFSSAAFAGRGGPAGRISGRTRHGLVPIRAATARRAAQPARRGERHGADRPPGTLSVRVRGAAPAHRRRRREGLESTIPSLPRRTVRDIDAALGSTPAVLLTSDRPVREWFRVRALDAREGLDVFALEPKVEDAPFTPHRPCVHRRGPAAHGARRSVRPDLPDPVHRHPAPPGHPGRGVHVHPAGGPWT